MARQTGTKISGTFGNVIYYKWRTGYYLRIKGNTGKQALVAQKQAMVLGLASNLSARIRKAAVPIIGIRTDRKLMYRLNNALQQWLRNSDLKKMKAVEKISSLNGFIFYGNPIDSYFATAVSVKRKAAAVSLYLPPPAGNDFAFQVIAISCSPENRDDTKTYETKISTVGTPQKVDLPLELREGCLTVVILSMKRATGIVGALYS